MLKKLRLPVSPYGGCNNKHSMCISSTQAENIAKSVHHHLGASACMMPVDLIVHSRNENAPIAQIAKKTGVAL
ncbi:MAG: hypothetical protein PHP85_01560 [Gallionella sp.]|nr:hypothetical protein [Gallionella sp.]